MAVLKVNPTRMELRKLKTRLKTATRGHKLLKDKSDEMIRQFIIFAREAKKLRESIEEELTVSLKNFTFATSVGGEQTVEEALMVPGKEVELETSTKNVMNVAVPVLTIKEGARPLRAPPSFYLRDSFPDYGPENFTFGTALRFFQSSVRIRSFCLRVVVHFPLRRRLRGLSRTHHTGYFLHLLFIIDFGLFSVNEKNRYGHPYLFFNEEGSIIIYDINEVSSIVRVSFH